MASLLRASRLVVWITVAVLSGILSSAGVLLHAEDDPSSDLTPERREFPSEPFDQGEEDQEAPSESSMHEEDLPAEDLPAEDLPPNTATSPGAEFPFSSERTGSLPPKQEQPIPVPGSPFPSGMLPAPQETPPFLSRPLEWESTPPTVIGMPSLPDATSFGERDLAAFQFVEEGKANFDHEEWDQAEEHFERAISIAPFLPYSYYFIGRIAFVRGELKRALAFLQKAELLFPRSERAWLGETTSVKGTVYEELNDYKQARIAYRRSLRFQPANLKILSALARLPEEELPTLAPISQ